MEKHRLKIGCVADDFTGASDIASFMRGRGLETILCSGIPDTNAGLDRCDVVVIALKTRSIPAEAAVKECMAAFEYLNSMGVQQLYFKYCSTFDSTMQGNIGPVLDAALEKFGLEYTLLCPALPVNGRTVKDGKLFVNGIPLHETHMKDHPLNPMWDCDISVLMREQSRYPCFAISVGDMLRGREYVAEKMAAFRKSSKHFYIVPDYYDDAHAELIYSIFGDLKLLSGGSGLMGNRLLGAESAHETVDVPEASGKTLLLAGSCSKMTLEQISEYKKTGNTMIKIYPDKVLDGSQDADSVWREAENIDRALIYSSDTAEAISAIAKDKREEAAKRIEKLMAELAERAIQAGYKQIIVAGGETSGAVTERIGLKSYLIGESIAAGVPIMVPTEHAEIRLVLKSGNFGKADFFAKAVKMTTEGNRGII